MTTTNEQPSTARRTGGVADLLFRSVVTAHTVAAFGQPVFAGVYLTGEIGGLDWHARGADTVFSLGLLQAAVGVAVRARTRRWWPAAVSLLLVAAETGQYLAGMSGLLWVHLPLGVMTIAALAVLAAAVWVRPLPRGAVAGRAGGVTEPRRDAADV
ncbi:MULTISPECIES: hypothetical protein [Streptomyces]|uniref:hypothetical protein n=1 Tax=Streptomyces TaxID=1883 RepID=UPI0016700958|nr:MULTISPECIES: hypothetical protein [Streptomyces]